MDKLRDREGAHDTLMYEHRTLRAKLEADNAELRGEIKLRSFELERMGLL